VEFDEVELLVVLAQGPEVMACHAEMESIHCLELGVGNRVVASRGTG